MRFYTLLIGLILLPLALAGETMEVTLIEHLPDEPRGWCIDAAGHQVNAIMEGGVHGHTCYTYEGNGVQVDQGFDAADIKKGAFRLTAFGHCLTVALPKAGTWIALTPCDGRPEQGFELKASGRIVPKMAPGLCITLGRQTVPGGGGRPIHQVRSLFLGKCESTNDSHQKWRLRDHKDW
ncbi:MAG: RICIN domain-containing protein [bacterium]|nr:RICIN domain-containing protein [bacterium]